MNASKQISPPNQATPDQLKAFRQYLSSKGLRVTNQRLAILEAVFTYSEHFTAEDLLAQAKQIDSSVSRATIYRTLPHLTGSGLVREVDIGRDNKYYLPVNEAKTFQTQVICTDCDKIFEVDAPFMEWYGKTVSEKLDMQPQSQRLQINSTCLKRGANHTCQRSCSKDG